METIDRRAMLRTLLNGAAVATAAVATISLTLIPNSVESAPLQFDKTLADVPDDLVEEAHVVVGSRRRGRRWVCWRNRWGRRVCGWRRW